MDPITPLDLASEFDHGESGRRVRACLRARHPDHGKYEHWLLTREQADDVRAHFG